MREVKYEKCEFHYELREVHYELREFQYELGEVQFEMCERCKYSAGEQKVKKAVGGSVVTVS